MIGLLKKWFTKKQSIKKFSTTLTPATEGTTTKKELSKEILDIINKIRKSDNVSNYDLNKIISYYFNLKPIEPGLFNLNKSIIENMCFEISKINFIYNEEEDIEDIFINLREITFNNDLVVTVSVKDFHEMFTHLNFQFVTSGD